MNKSLTKHVQSIGKEFNENLVEMSPLRGQDMHNRPVLYDVENDKIDEIKSHLLQPQLKIIELVKEEFQGKLNVLYDSYGYEDGEEVVSGEIKALSQAITLLDTIIQDIKSQIK